MLCVECVWGQVSVPIFHGLLPYPLLQLEELADCLQNHFLMLSVEEYDILLHHLAFFIAILNDEPGAIEIFYLSQNIEYFVFL